MTGLQSDSNRTNSGGKQAMKFRDHPAFIRMSGLMLWPPQWSNTNQPREVWPGGEIGTLERVWTYELLDTSVFLYMRHDAFRYISILYFGEDRASCMMIYDFLKSVVGRSIAEIGDLDISHLL